MKIELIRKQLFVFFFLFLFIISCSEDDSNQPMDGQQQGTQQNQSPCGDGVCDDKEQESGFCPTDCGSPEQGSSAKNTEAATTSKPTTQTTDIDLFGTMLAFQSSQGFSGNKELEEQATEDWGDFWEENSETFLANMEKSFGQKSSKVKETGFSSNRDVVGAFAWNVIENTKGTYDWSLADATVQAVQDAGITYVATVYPYSNWASPDDIDPASCVGIDPVYFDYKTGYPEDEDAYEAFLRALVERYDGDGVDDMDGLTTPITLWEIANEVEGTCTGSLSDGETYYKLLKMSYNAIKEEQPDAVVVNAGALEIVGSTGDEMDDTITFWEDFFAAGGASYTDRFNFHYNRERSEPANSMEIYEKHLSFFRDLLDENNAEDTKLWITEFGVGTKQDIHGNDVDLDDRTKTDYTVKDQASWYFRYTIMGMSYGVERIFIDLSGSDGSGLGSSAFFSQEGARPFLTTLQALADALEDYDTVEVLEEGQYLFTVNGENVYALWHGELPSEISGTVTVIDVLGEESEMDADEISFSEDSPVLVVVE